MRYRSHLPSLRSRVLRRPALLSLCSLAAVALLTPAPALAQPTMPTEPDTHDVQLWTQVVATVGLTDNWLAHLEVQPRWADDMSELDQIIVRNAVGRRLSPRLTLWGGHAWIPSTRGPGTRHEQRIWEQASITLPDAGAWTPSVRIRLEQRFLDSWDDSSHRLRVMVRGVRPLNQDKTWSFATSNEVMFTLDETESGPAQGVDQNRLFAGILRKFSAKASLETGYLWRTSDPPGENPRTHHHVAFVWLNLTLPRAPR